MLSSQKASLPPVTTRRYEQRQRAEDAEKTRQRIVDAVLERLRAAPAEPVAIEKIAAMAGVARSTVYAIFGSRAGLFDAVGTAPAGAHRLRAPGRGVAPAPTPATAFRGGLRAASEMLAAERDTWRALRSMAQLDQEAVGGSVQRWEDERAAAMARIAGQLHEQGHLRPERHRRGGQRRPLGDHQLRELRPALQRPRPAARRGGRAADRRGRARADDALGGGVGRGRLDVLVLGHELAGGEASRPAGRG